MSNFFNEYEGYVLISTQAKGTLQVGLYGIVPSTAPQGLTRDTTLSNYFLIVDEYYKIPKLYGMEKIKTEEVMDKLDMFQSRFGKIDEFGGGI